MLPFGRRKKFSIASPVCTGSDPGAKSDVSHWVSRQPQMPRRSSASLTIAAFAPGLRRLDPPSELGPVEREIFKQVVASVPANHFASEDMALLCAFSRSAALERRAAEELQASAVVGTVPSPWLAVHASAVRSLATLTVRLRLGPRSRDPNNRRSSKPSAPPSYYDSMERRR
jgi:hypothetical protein